MLRWNFTLAVLLVVNGGWAMACTQEISDGELSRQFPKGKLLRGDLNNDGVSDIAVLYTEQAAREQQDRIAIYEGRSTGSYCFAVRSGKLEYGRTDVELKKGSIFVEAFSNSARQSTVEIYQFRYRSGRYLLIGFEESVFHPEEGTGYRDSRNYLTGKGIEKTTRNRKANEKMSALGSDEMALMPLDQFQR